MRLGRESVSGDPIAVLTPSLFFHIVKGKRIWESLKRAGDTDLAAMDECTN